jgi:hypothetical protein
MLLRLIAEKEFQLELFSELVADINFEEKSIKFLLILSLFCQKHGWRNVPPHLLPRMKGIVQFFRYQNASLYANFWKIGKELGGMGCPIFLLKQAAIRAMDDESLPRCMKKIDFFVPEDFHEIAIKATENCEFAVSWATDRETEVSNGSYAFGIHHSVFPRKNWTVGEKLITLRAKGMVTFSTEVLCPCREDLLLLTLSDVYETAISAENHTGADWWMYECIETMNVPNFNWPMFFEMARRLGIFYEVAILLNALVARSSVQIPEKFFGKYIQCHENEKDAKRLVEGIVLHGTTIKKREYKNLAAQPLRTFVDFRNRCAAKIRYLLWKALAKFPQFHILLLKSFFKTS